MTESESEYSPSSSEEELDLNISGEVESICVPYQDEPLASTDESSDESDEYEEDGLSPSTLERRYNKIELIESWYDITSSVFV